VEALGFDAAVDRRDPAFAERLADTIPSACSCGE